MAGLDDPGLADRRMSPRRRRVDRASVGVVDDGSDAGLVEESDDGVFGEGCAVGEVAAGLVAVDQDLDAGSAGARGEDPLKGVVALLGE